MRTVTWVLIVIIISIVQSFIWYAAFVNSGNGSALNYISFAGTLVSIILAVLAIGYTYGDSILQRSRSGSISEKIAILNDVLKNVQSGSKQLDEISDISKNLLRMESNLKSHFENTNVRLDDFSEIMSSHQPSFKEGDVESSRRLSYDASNSLIRHIIYLLVTNAEGHVYSSIPDLIEKEVRDVLEGEELTHKYLIAGMLVASISIYKATNVVDFEVTGSEGFFYKIDEKYKKEMIDVLKNRPNDGSDSLQRIYESLKDK